MSATSRPEALRGPHLLNTPRELREHIPAPADRIRAKIQRQLEAGGRDWIEASRLVGLAVRRPDGLVEVAVRAHGDGIARAPSDYLVRIGNEPDSRVGDVDEAIARHPFAGLIFIRPGVDSTVRANGSARLDADGSSIALDVAETYVHCPKAFVRSKLWAAGGQTFLSPGPEAGPSIGPAARRFIEASPFALLGTCLEDGSADVSPRGDPPGFVRIIDDHTLIVPDRPGNRIADSFRNILEHPSAGLLFLIPGVDWVLQVSGIARITDDETWLAPLAVKGRAPKLGIWLDVRACRLEPAPALREAGVWEASAEVQSVASAGRLLVQQMEPKGRFLRAKGKMVDWMLARDAKKNLY